MARYEVYLETSAESLAEGGYLAHVPELPGCVARGKTKEEAIAGIRAAFRRCQESAEPFELEIVETEEVTFPPDRAPLNEEDLKTLAEHASASRMRLLDTLAALPPDALTWRESDDTWAIRNILAHLAQGDLWYASRLQPGGLPELAWRLGATRTLLLETLTNLPSDQRGAVTCHDGEEWTPRKVIRRMLEHEQEHMDQIREILVRYEKASPS